MQESEAKKKRCPKVQVIIIPSNSTWKGQMITSRGDIYTDSKDLLCLGTACMMWDSFEYEARIFKGHDRSYELEIKNVGQGDCGLKVGTLEIEQ